MPTRAAVAPSGQEITTWALRTGFSETPTVATAVSTWKTVVESEANPTASTHQANPPVVTKRTRAPRAPAAAGRSTRTGCHASPYPGTEYTSVQMPPLFTRTARAVSTLTSLRQEYHSRPRHSESARAFLVSSWPLALRTVSDAGAGAAASRLTRTSGHTDVTRGAAAGREPAAAIAVTAKGRLSRNTRSTSALSSGNAKP